MPFGLMCIVCERPFGFFENLSLTLRAVQRCWECDQRLRAFTEDTLTWIEEEWEGAAVAPERREAPHDLLAAREDRDREAVGDRLAEGRQVGRDAEDRLRAAERLAKPGDHLVEDEGRPVAGAELSTRL